MGVFTIRGHMHKGCKRTGTACPNCGKIHKKTTGDDSPNKLPENRLKNSMANKGRMFTPEHCLRIGISNKGKPQPIGCSQLGKKRTKEQREHMSIGQIGRKMSDITKQRMSESQINRYIKDPMERIRMAHTTRINNLLRIYQIGSQLQSHLFTKLFIAIILVGLGYTVYLEKFVTIYGRRYAIDIRAEKDDDVLVFEVGGCKKQKFHDLMSYYSKVFQVPKIRLKGDLL